MDISEVRISLPDGPANDNFLAHASVTFDDSFVIREIKVLRGAKGDFVAMPSRKIVDRCPECRCKNHLRARFCNACGRRLADGRVLLDAEGHPTREPGGALKLHADVAHPVNQEVREWISGHVMAAYHAEAGKSVSPLSSAVARLGGRS